MRDDVGVGFISLEPIDDRQKRRTIAFQLGFSESGKSQQHRRWAIAAPAATLGGGGKAVLSAEFPAVLRRKSRNEQR